MSSVLTNLILREAICIDSKILPQLLSLFDNDNNINSWMNNLGTFYTFDCMNNKFILVLSYEKGMNNENEFKIRVLNDYRGIEAMKAYITSKDNYFKSNFITKLTNKIKVDIANNVLKQYTIAENMESIKNIEVLYNTLYKNYLFRPNEIEKLRIRRLNNIKDKINVFINLTTQKFNKNLSNELENILNNDNNMLNPNMNYYMDKINNYINAYKTQAFIPPNDLNNDEKQLYLTGINNMIIQSIGNPQNLYTRVKAIKVAKDAAEAAKNLSIKVSEAIAKNVDKNTQIAMQSALQNATQAALKAAADVSVLESGKNI